MNSIEALRLFVRLADHRSFSAAARDLGIKQSTASKWVAELEHQFGRMLVERTTRSVRITDAGHRLQHRAIEILAAVDALAVELSDRNSEPMGRVRLSVPVVFGRLFVVPLVAKFLARYPKIDAVLAFSDRYVNLVEEGFDLAIRVGVPADTSAKGRKLADSRRYLVASPRYVKKHGRPASPRDLEHHPCLLHADAGAAVMWRFHQGTTKAKPVRVHGRVAANNSEAVLALAREGLGVALLADWLVAADLKQNKLVHLLAEYHTPPAPVYALTPPGRYMPFAVRALLDHLVESLDVRVPLP